MLILQLRYFAYLCCMLIILLDLYLARVMCHYTFLTLLLSLAVQP